MDKINGKGKMVYEDGSVYDGEWVDGMKQGKGVERAGITNLNEMYEFTGLFE